MNFDTTLDILRAILHTETDFSFVMDIIPADGANNIADYGLKSMVLPSVINIPAFWEMCDPENYEYIKSLRLDSVKNAKLIEKSRKSETASCLTFPRPCMLSRRRASAFR